MTALVTLLNVLVIGTFIVFIVSLLLILFLRQIYKLL
jgi:hypothetical protein